MSGSGDSHDGHPLTFTAWVAIAIIAFIVLGAFPMFIWIGSKLL